MTAVAATIDLEGRTFRRTGDTGAAVAVYHQDGDVVWAEVAGGAVRRGAVTGRRDPGGLLRMGYTIVFNSGEIVCGFTVNTPELGADGRLRLREEWQRYGRHAATGVSYLEEVT